MPELPEVELTKRRLERELVGKRITGVSVRAPKLRLPIPGDLATSLTGHTLRAISRRGKYLLFDCETGWLIVHLGMTGFLRFLPAPHPPGKHDHLDVVFDGGYLFRASRSRRIAVKQLLMDAAIVAGVGNIYANEALFRAAIRPDRHADSLTLPECERLALAVRDVLEDSIGQGSTYRVAEDSVAYHPLAFAVYGRGKGSCTRCGGVLEELRLGNRSTVYCPRCQV